MRTMAADRIPAPKILQGNANLVGAGTWTGASIPRPEPLPGHEHGLEWDDLPLAGVPMPISSGGAR